MFFIASFAKLLNIELAEEEAYDSRDMLAAFLGDDSDGLPYMIEESRGLALRQGNWKYIAAPKKKRGKKPAAKRAELYDLGDDPSEQKNIIAQHPEKAKSMDKLLQESINAEGLQ